MDDAQLAYVLEEENRNFAYVLEEKLLKFAYVLEKSTGNGQSYSGIYRCGQNCEFIRSFFASVGAAGGVEFEQDEKQDCKAP